MSSYFTTVLRNVCETLTGHTEPVDFPEIFEVIAAARPIIFDFPYDIPVADKERLETNIIQHYYFRELGWETVPMWRFKLRAKMQEIMPYYNQLYLSAHIEYEPLEDVNYRRSGNRSEDENIGKVWHTADVGSNTSHTVETTNDHEQTNDTTTVVSSVTGKADDIGHTSGTVDGSDHTSANSLDLHADTPQGKVTGLFGTVEPPTPGQTNEQTYKYLSDARSISSSENKTTHQENVGDTTAHTETESNRDDTTHLIGDRQEDILFTNDRNDETNLVSDHNGSEARDRTDVYWETVKGKYPGKTYAELIKLYRDTFINIDRLVIKELEDLFMQVW